MDCVKNGPPDPGTHIDVKWTDNKTYDAIFNEINAQKLYHVSNKILSILF